MLRTTPKDRVSPNCDISSSLLLCNLTSESHFGGSETLL